MTISWAGGDNAVWMKGPAETVFEGNHRALEEDTMNPDDVARFLRSNPKFFDQHPELLETIHVPHPHGGRAIPLTERQTVALREKAQRARGQAAAS